MCEPIRIKAGETFKVRITLPVVDCPCGTKMNDLTFYDDEEGAVHAYCPQCRRAGPPADDRWFALLAWGGMITREKAGG